MKKINIKLCIVLTIAFFLTGYLIGFYYGEKDKIYCGVKVNIADEVTGHTHLSPYYDTTIPEGCFKSLKDIKNLKIRLIK